MEARVELDGGCTKGRRGPAATLEEIPEEPRERLASPLKNKGLERNLEESEFNVYYESRPQCVYAENPKLPP
jgi:hypothetical protein